MSQDATRANGLAALGYEQGFRAAFEAYQTQHSSVCGLLPARVLRRDGARYLVHDGMAERHAYLKGRSRSASDDTDSATVGDWVALEEDSSAQMTTLYGLLPRKNRFSRKVAGKATKEQVVAANLDHLFIVVALDVDFNLRRIERYLTSVPQMSVNPIVVLSKADLCEGAEDYLEKVRAVAPNVRAIATSNVTRAGFDELDEFLTAQTTVAFVGSSGVGKSTFINALAGDARLRTGEIRERDSRGQHTTSHRELITLPSGAMLIDTPGMRELSLWADESQLDSTFEDIEGKSWSCRFRDCTHEGEPGCAVQEALDNGELGPERLASYHKQKSEILSLRERRAEKQRRQKKGRDVARFARELKKRGGKWAR